MIRVEKADPAGSAEWETLVEHCGGNALHLPAIHFAYNDPSNLHLLKFEHDGSAVACAIAFESKSGRWPKRVRALTLPTAPAIAQAELAAAIRSSLLQYAGASGFDRLLVHPAYGRYLTEDEEFTRFRTKAITEFVLDLRAGEESVLAGMHKTHRKNIRRAAKQDLRVEEDSSLAGLLRLRDMQLASSDRASERAEGFQVREERFFEKLHRDVYAGGRGHVLFASLGPETVAALAWVSTASRAQTVRSGSLPEGYRARVMYSLHDVLIRRVIAEGKVELNIGGVPAEASDAEHPQSGLYEFKLGFGGQAVTRHGLDIPLKEL